MRAGVSGAGFRLTDIGDFLGALKNTGRSSVDTAADVSAQSLIIVALPSSGPMHRFPLPKLLSSAVQRIKTQSILAPLLALDVICGVMALGVTVMVGDTLLSRWIWVSFGVSVAFTLVAYTYWSFREPERLQTEDYRLAREHLMLIGDERNPNSPELLEGRPVSKAAHFAEYQN
jgi:hypothetical protein